MGTRTRNFANNIDATGAPITLTQTSVNAHATEFDDDKLQTKLALLGFKTATVGSLASYNLANQSIDEFANATKIDAGNSTNEILTDGAIFGGTSGTPTGGNSSGTYTYDSVTYNYKKFTANGTFVAPSSGTVDVFVLAGGGATVGDNGGGGGAGGLVWKESLTVSAGNHTVTVGAGGTGTTAGSQGSSTTGSDSVFSSYITGKGGGYGGSSSVDAGDGGSGGGGGRVHPSSAKGDATQPSQAGNSAGLGYNGGEGRSNSTGPGGGGGGAGAVGSNASSGTVGNGGVGSSTFIGSSAAATTAFLLGTVSGTNSSNAATTNSSGGTLYIAGGGSGGTQDRGTHGSGGNGGIGGGANIGGNDPGNNALVNTGSGGSSTTSGGGTGGNGGSGLVIVRYTANAFEGAGQDLTLQSTATTAASQPSTADMVMLMQNNAGTATLNTDLKAYVSRDSGTTFTQGTLADEGDYDTNKKILSFHDLDISGQPAGTSMKFKVTTHNQAAGSKETYIHAVSLGWK